MSLDTLTFETYLHAYDHAISRVRCAHVACGILINGELVCVATNTEDTHAEYNAFAIFNHLGTHEFEMSYREKDCYQYSSQFVKEGQECVLCAGSA
jgi:hypothetical protein